MEENETKDNRQPDPNGLMPIVNERLTSFKQAFLADHPLKKDVDYLVELTRTLLVERVRFSAAAAAAMTGTKSLMGDLTVMVKYQTFDLEATRRENEVLKKLLSEHGIGPE